jgi:DGQHR domain-containing protein
MSRRRRTPPTPDQLRKREERAFSRKIQTTFKNVGFQYLSTNGKQRQFGSKQGELDAVFLYENIILVCEDTTSSTGLRDHLINKKVLFDEINNNRPDLISWLKQEFPDKFSAFSQYNDARYKVFFLYFTKNKFNPTDDDIELFKPVKVVEQSSLNYFQKLSSNIRRSSRSEIFRFLGLESDDVGVVRSSGDQNKISTTIICPPDSTGHTNGVRLVSFMLSADSLIRNSYVLRKDNWENSIELYQRLIERNRIQSIRRHLATKKTTFYNNIIVTLPRNVSFTDENNNPVELSEIQDYKKSHTLLIPNEYNSICVIDGQHRIFAHYEGDDNLEATIAPLRQQFHLLVTGLIFPDDMDDHSRRKYESEIFLDINSNAKPVPPDVLLFIQTLQDPYSDLGISRRVLEKLNQRAPFHNLLQLSLMEASRIKIASIIKFAMRNLVEITEDTERKDTFYYHWSQQSGKNLKTNPNANDLDEYINYIVNLLSIYFGAVKSTYGSEWDDTDSKLLSTTAINGYIMALRRSLQLDGPKDHTFYAQAISKEKFGFSKGRFAYTSSQYNKFSKVILEKCFNIGEDADGNWVKLP